ncbi:hypothetical protein FOMPIDRAFT_39794, partial [Fomitopsis schrenkii]
GSLYILMLIAVQNLHVPLGGVDGHAARHIGNMLRQPDGKFAYHIVINMLTDARFTGRTYCKEYCHSSYITSTNTVSASFQLCSSGQATRPNWCNRGLALR